MLKELHKTMLNMLIMASVLDCDDTPSDTVESCSECSIGGSRITSTIQRYGPGKCWICPWNNPSNTQQD
eukprot:12575534-Ditylum_brightwellii.AAC.1